MRLEDLVVAIRSLGAPQFLQTMQRVESGINKVGVRIVVFNQALSLTRQSLRALSAAFESVIGPGREFEQSMARSTAIMGKLSTTTRDSLRETALTLSGQFVQSANDAAKAYFYLASAGLDAESSMAALPTVMQFATAGAFDLSTATDLLTDAQSALGRTIRDDSIKNMENMREIADALVIANTKANASVQQFSEALQNKGGAAARVLNRSLGETLGLLGALADQGTKGSGAGDALNQILRDLPNAFSKAESAWHKYNLEILDGDRNLKNLAEVTRILTKEFSKYSAVDLRRVTRELKLQDRSIIRILQILGTANLQESIQAAVDRSTGATSEVAAKQLQNVADQFQIFKNLIENVKTEAFLKQAKDLNRILQDMQSIVERNHDTLENFYSDAISGFASLGENLSIVTDNILQFSGAVNNFELPPDFQRLLDILQAMAAVRVGVTAGAALGTFFGGAPGAVIGATAGAAIGGGFFANDAFSGFYEFADEVAQLSQTAFGGATDAWRAFGSVILDGESTTIDLDNAWREFNNSINKTGTEVAKTKYYFEELAAIANNLNAPFDAREAQIVTDRRDISELSLAERLRIIMEGAKTTSFDIESLDRLRNDIYNSLQLTDQAKQNAMEILDAIQEGAEIDIKKQQQLFKNLAEGVNKILEDEAGSGYADTLKEVLRLVEDSREPFMKYRDEVLKVQKVYEAGDITEQQYIRTVEDLTDKYDKQAAQLIENSDAWKARLKEIRETQRAEEELQRLVDNWKNKLNPVVKLREEYETLAKTGQFTAEELSKIEASMVEGLRSDGVTDAQRDLENAVRGVGDELTDAIVEGFEGGTDAALNIWKSFSTEIAKILTRELLVAPVLDPIVSGIRNARSGVRADVISNPGGGEAPGGAGVDAQAVVSDFSQIPNMLGSGLSAIFGDLRNELAVFTGLLFAQIGGKPNLGQVALRAAIGSFVSGVTSYTLGAAFNALNSPGVLNTGNADFSFDGLTPTPDAPLFPQFELDNIVPQNFSGVVANSSVYAPPPPGMQTNYGETSGNSEYVVNVQPVINVRAFTPEDMRRAVQAQSKEISNMVATEINRGRGLARAVNRRA